jgi:small GTP-binding protein
MSSECLHRRAKVVLIGEARVGKTTLISQFVSGYNWGGAPTVRAEYSTKDCQIDGGVVPLSIWDTAGQEKFRSISPLFLRHAKMVLVVFSVVDEKSFEALRYWLGEVRTQEQEQERHAQVLLVGNKVDILNRSIDFDRAAQFAADAGLDYCETSAQTGQGVDAAFQKLVETWVLRCEELDEPTHVTLSDDPPEKHCC